MFYYQEIKSSPCVPCSKEDFERVVNDGHVRTIINQVRAQSAQAARRSGGHREEGDEGGRKGARAGKPIYAELQAEEG